MPTRTVDVLIRLLRRRGRQGGDRKAWGVASGHHFGCAEQDRIACQAEMVSLCLLNCHRAAGVFAPSPCRGKTSGRRRPLGHPGA